MNLLTTGRRIALVSSVVAALLATGYAASEHHSVQALHNQLAERESMAYDQAADAQQVASDEACSQDDAQATDDDALPRVRQAARDFIQDNKPGVKSEGVFTFTLRPGNLYIAGVDTTEGSQHRTIDLLVRLYVKKNGGQYWRAESLGPDRAAALMDKVSAATAPADDSAASSDSEQ